MLKSDKLVILAAALSFVVLSRACVKSANAGPYVEVAAYWHDMEYDDIRDNVPILISIGGGYTFDSGFFIEAEHTSDPDRLDTGLNTIGGGFRYEW